MNQDQKSVERGFALQKYLVLHGQHDALQRHISQITASIPTTANTSPSRSPERNRHASMSSSSSDDGNSVSSSPPTNVRHHFRSGSLSQPYSRRPSISRKTSLPTVVDESILDEIEEDQTKMRDVNLQIKSTLTELLNCESVRNDGRYRLWVQTRLMDAERELRGARSRRRSVDIPAMVYQAYQ